VSEELQNTCEPIYLSRLRSLGSYAKAHPSVALAAAGGLGYFLAHGYFGGKASVWGVPFGFSWSTGGYVELALFTAVFVVIGMASLIPTAAGIKAVEKSPRLELGFMIGYPLLVIAFIAVMCSVAGFRRWVFGLYEPLLPVVATVSITIAATLLCVRLCKHLRWSLLFAGIALIGLYFLMFWFGADVEQKRSSWRIASTGNTHYVVAGRGSEHLLVAPLISTSPPTYVKAFRYLDILTPDLKVQTVRWKEMVRQDGPGVVVSP